MAFYSESFLVLKASAGSGKTFALTIRYISLLFSGAKSSEILAITFTKKATLEMRQRIKSALQEIANPHKYPESAFLKALLDEGFSRDFILQEAPRIYAEFLIAPSRISTIDSFVNTVLRKFCWYVGLSVEYQSGSNKDYEIITELFLENVYKQSGSFELLAQMCADLRLDFNRFMKFAEDCYGDKIHFSNQVLDKFLKQPTEIKALQDDIKTLEKHIMNALLGLKGWITQEGLSQRAQDAIKTNSFYEALAQPFTWLTSGVDYCYFSALRKNENLEAVLQDKITEIQRLFYQYYQMRQELIFAHIALVLQCYVQANNACITQKQQLSFEDCNIKAYELLALGKDLGGIDPLFFYFRLDNKIKHILVDEFQDTNPMQYAILKPLIEEIHAGVGQSFGERSVFFVGDVKQSIYRFRGSDSELFEVAEKNMQIQNLEYNYRSYGNVLDFINRCFKGIYADYIPQMLPLDSTKKDLGFVHIKLVPSPIDGVIASVQELIDSGVDLNKVAILCFQNKDITTLYEELKGHFNIDIVPEVRLSFLHKRSVRALISGLEFLWSQHKPQDSNQDSQDCTVSDFFLYDFIKLCGFRAFDTDISPLKEKLLECYSALPRECILKMMNSFEIVDKSAQLFLQNSIAYKSIDSFLEDLDSIKWNPPKEALQGLHILSIHASKGLEFEYVIVCDRLALPRTSQSQIIFSQDAYPFVKIKNREIFDEPFAQAQQYQAQKDLNERNNVLYVASTRGKKGLIIVATNECYKSKPENGAQKSKSAFSIMLKQIDMEPNPQEIEARELRIGEIIPSERQNNANNNKPILLQQQSFGTQEIGIRNEDMSVQIRDIKNMIFGEALHLGLECGLGFSIDSVNIKHILRYLFGLDDEVLQTIVGRIECLKNDEVFKEIIHAKRAFVELPILIDGRLRRIDFLALNDKEAVIVDYKSGFASKELHIQQVKNYIQGIQSILPEHNISGYLVYVREKNIWEKVC